MRSAFPAPARPYRVVIADDHPIMRGGLRTMLEADPALDVVGEAANGDEALRLVRALAPDVLLLDMEMPGLTGVEVARAVQAEALPVRVLALSAYDDAAYVSGLMRSGAAGYITKDKSPAMIVEAVQAVGRGEGRWFVLPPRTDPDASPLSDREQEVLRLMARGLSNEGIGAALFISENTVRNHISNVYGKLDVKSWREAIAWAWQNGVMEKP